MCRDPEGEQNHEGYEPQKEQFLNFDFMSISHENTVQVAVNFTHELMVKELIANLLRVKRFLYHVFSLDMGMKQGYNMTDGIKG